MAGEQQDDAVPLDTSQVIITSPEATTQGTRFPLMISLWVKAQRVPQIWFDRDSDGPKLWSHRLNLASPLRDPSTIHVIEVEPSSTMKQILGKLETEVFSDKAKIRADSISTPEKMHYEAVLIDKFRVVWEGPEYGSRWTWIGMFEEEKFARVLKLIAARGWKDELRICFKLEFM